MTIRMKRSKEGRGKYEQRRGVMEDQENQGGLGSAREGSGRECVRISSGLAAAPTSEASSC